MIDSLNIIQNKTSFVSFAVFVNGKELDVPFEALSGTVTFHFSEIGTAELIFADGNQANESFESSERDELMVGNEIAVSIGYENRLQPIFNGIIVKHSVLCDGGVSYLVITAKHKAFKMGINKNNHLYQNCSDSEIMTNLIDTYSLPNEVQSTQIEHECVTQFDCSDWDFLNLRAETNAMFVLTEGDSIIIKEPDLNATPALTVESTTEVLEFTAEMDGRSAFKEYKSVNWSSTDQSQSDETWVTGDGDVNQGNSKSEDLAQRLENPTKNIYLNTPLYDENVAAQMVRSSIVRDNLSRITGMVKIPGNASVHLGDLIDIHCMGKRFNGKALVTGVEHSFEQGSWYTTYYFGLPNEPYAKKYDDINSLPADGSLPAVNGLQIGKVVQITDDPLGEERILIQLPHFAQSAPAIWARMARIDAGHERGIVFMPEVDDEVVVGFINDNPACAVILGMVHSSANPSPVQAAKENNIKGIYTRGNVRLEFDDEKHSVCVETPGGNTVSVSDDDKQIMLSDQNGNKLVMNEKGITIESSKKIQIKSTGDLNLEGANVSAKANSSFKAEGIASSEVSSNGNTTIKGTMVLIN